MRKYVILVDKNDKEIGTMEKIQTHTEAKLHRCFSIFIFNFKGKMLLQKRAANKYHSGGLWSNACCGHPKPGEKTEQAAQQRLKEEMGFSCDLRKLLTFTYKASFHNGLTEWEIDHVFCGVYNDEVRPDLEEAEEFKWLSTEELRKDIEDNPDNYTPWFKIALPKVMEADKL
ncbi:MAG: isopentenyl-diphosphate Delta-isomerase [Patescibacteria group bacterium]